MLYSEQMILNLQAMDFDPSKPCHLSEDQIDVILKAGPPSKSAIKVNGREVSIVEARVYFLTQCFPAVNLDGDDSEFEGDDFDENNNHNIADMDDDANEVSDAAYHPGVNMDSLVVPPHYFYAEEPDAGESDIDLTDMDDALDDDWDSELTVSDIEWEFEACPEVRAPPTSPVQWATRVGLQEVTSFCPLADSHEPEAASGEQEMAMSNRCADICEAEVAIGEQEVASGEKEVVSGEHEMVDGEQEVASGEQEVVGGEQEVASSEHELVGGEQEVASGEQKVVSCNSLVLSCELTEASSVLTARIDNHLVEVRGDLPAEHEDNGDNACASESPPKSGSQAGPIRRTPSARQTRFRPYLGDARQGGPPRARKSLF